MYAPSEPLAPQFIYSFVHLLIRSFTHSFVYSFVRLLIRSFTHSFVYSFVHSLIRSFTHSFIHSFLPPSLISSSLRLRCCPSNQETPATNAAYSHGRGEQRRPIRPQGRGSQGCDSSHPRLSQEGNHVSRHHDIAAGACCVSGHSRPVRRALQGRED